jgi:formylglycine-generating enzyme required for sulfatase activity
MDCSDEPGLCPFLRFPITGITYEQAEEFCKWRTKVLGNGKIEFRLPSESEWKNFAVIGLSPDEKKNGYRDSIYSNGCPMYNYKYSNPCERFLNAGLELPRQIGVVRFMKDKNGAFDVFGNVSEMTNIKGIAKGGNYKTFANQSNVDSIQKYNKPEIWLGFRCISIIR